MFRVMRFGRLILFLILLAAPSLARADQTDPQLTQLFDDLRQGDSVAAGDTVARIEEIWATSSSETATLLYDRAFTSATDGDLDLALALCDHVVGLAPHFAQGYALRGFVRLRLGRRDEARADLEETLALEPRQFEARVALSDLLSSAGKPRDAYDMLQEALKWNPHDEEALKRARSLRDTLARQDT